jgi:hypothetical protein
MKKLFMAVAIACLAIFSSCDKQGVSHTGDATGDLYGVWKLEKRTDVVPQSDGTTKTTETDYTSVNFYLALSNLGVPHALAKKGSFTALDLKDVDVDGTIFTYNADLKQMSFRERLWLTELPAYSMELKGTYDVLELTPGTLVIQQKNLLEVKTYSFKKVQASN